MHVSERESGDRARLLALARKEKSAEQKDRFLAVAHALAGMETKDIRRALARSKDFVQRWAYAYRDGGIGALKAKPRGGSVPKLRGATAEKLKARIEAGPTPADKVCTLRGKDVQRIARDELGEEVSLPSVYRFLHHHGYSCLAPRPRHEKQDPGAQKTFKEQSAPLLSVPSARLLSLTAGTCGSSSWTRPGSGSRAP